MQDQYASLDKNNKLIWNFRDIGRTMRRISEGQGSQKRVLMLLWETNGMTQKKLTARLGVQPGSASEVIGKLEHAGLIFRTASESDRRTTDILAKEAYEQRVERHEQMFTVLSREEKDADFHAGKSQCPSERKRQSRAPCKRLWKPQQKRHRPSPEYHP